jgi:hypothetical protein
MLALGKINVSVCLFQTVPLNSVNVEVTLQVVLQKKISSPGCLFNMVSVKLRAGC